MTIKAVEGFVVGDDLAVPFTFSQGVYAPPGDDTFRATFVGEQLTQPVSVRRGRTTAIVFTSPARNANPPR